jgi:hypothetical protein
MGRRWRQMLACLLVVALSASSIHALHAAAPAATVALADLGAQPAPDGAAPAAPRDQDENARVCPVCHLMASAMPMPEAVLAVPSLVNDYGLGSSADLGRPLATTLFRPPR